MPMIIVDLHIFYFHWNMVGNSILGPCCMPTSENGVVVQPILIFNCLKLVVMVIT